MTATTTKIRPQLSLSLADDLIQRIPRWVHGFRRKTNHSGRGNWSQTMLPFVNCIRKAVNTDESEELWRSNIKSPLTPLKKISFSFHSPCTHVLPLSVHVNRWLFDGVLGGSYTLMLFILTLPFLVLVVWHPPRSSMGSMVKEPTAYTSFLEIKREGQREGVLIYELPTAIGDALAGWS